MTGWTLGKVSGIEIRLHWTFVLLPIYIYFSSLASGFGIAGATTSVLLVLAIFGCVLLHELGHAFAARQFGIPTRDITLLPIGGVAALERIPRNPLQEMWIAVAGPLVNVVIAAALLLLIGFGGIFNGGFFASLALANIVLVLFNLIPAFPMDGGRILRSSLALFTNWHHATEIAVSVGKILAVGLGFAGLLSGNIMMLFVAMFVWFAANSELAMARTRPREARQSSEVQWNLHSDEGVPASTTAKKAAMWLASRRGTYCRVVESGKTIGTVTKAQLLSALSRGLGQTPIGKMIP